MKDRLKILNEKKIMHLFDMQSSNTLPYMIHLKAFARESFWIVSSRKQRNTQRTQGSLGNIFDAPVNSKMCLMIQTLYGATTGKHSEIV